MCLSIKIFFDAHSSNNNIIKHRSEIANVILIINNEAKILDTYTYIK